jgi:RNA polymerase sigma-70 factor (ECF subfamily)
LKDASGQNLVSKPDLIRYGKYNPQRFVKRDHGPPVEGAAIFRTVHRRVVLRAAQSQPKGGLCALARLCRLYWHTPYAFVRPRPRGYGPDDAQDLTQGFFLRLLDRRALARVDPLKGKFRSLSEWRLNP